ncbi:hypothetical protein [Waddlia chondrophila]|uniref:Uncharacterized protein n=1 Tax=Waddlia chondrophila (strain ATCC VR-1470 / WSU 86-1044) TaxID=716544 RepID=D6YT80_WADCW|nr:hypothetical protein [Waddlia chondrophila]ADI39275.1 hypothetical protein wcw_1942 [Waddlia chondrophila WSU 86-1044]
MANTLSVHNSLASALNYEYECHTKSRVLGKVHKFSGSWIEPRERFAVAAYEAQVAAIHSLASAIFHTLWSMTAGKLFTDKEARHFAVQSWKDFGDHLVSALKGFLGVISPTIADWADKKVMTVRSNEEEGIELKDQRKIDEPSIEVNED